jgi:hypothetical protein
MLALSPALLPACLVVTAFACVIFYVVLTFGFLTGHVKVTRK